MMKEIVVALAMAVGTLALFIRLWNITRRDREELGVIERPYLRQSFRPLIVTEGSVWHRVLRLMVTGAFNVLAAGMLLFGCDVIDWPWLVVMVSCIVLMEMGIVELFLFSRERKYTIDLEMCRRQLERSGHASVRPLRRIG